ncbi:uncharacterized protein BXZ73DRAFT_88838 [Epithele typhae]|uniref:uncharacterized protein n=1 Tax=Epithele typhae TaxID=378194 RepID=UPI002007C57C|nr:uncharacterized protein BXZ73DRAFT_88838 [Epithele typhae]KAH9940153.1 hypothetical protein BXZ73DRAFT_88838 [Epithele typhae]
MANSGMLGVLRRSVRVDLMSRAKLRISKNSSRAGDSTIKCEKTDDKTRWDWAVLQGDVWKVHGAQVAECTRFLPGSFDRPPRNPAEKIKSGYKAWEFLMYVFGLGPCLLYASPLPLQYFVNFCQLVRAIRITLAYSIREDDLLEAHSHFMQFTTEFEELYYNRRADRLHFVRQSIHALSHICPEVRRLGPQACYTQWVMERAIGSLTQELRNHSNPYANLSERFVRRALINALKAMFPELEHTKYKSGEYPRGAEEVGSGYVLLRAVDTKERTIRTEEGNALREYLKEHDPPNKALYEDAPAFRVARWARLLLPNGQIARSYWKEGGKTKPKLRVSRNVKIVLNGEIRYGEVQYFIHLKIGNRKQGVAMLSLWSLPEPTLLKLSCKTIYSSLPGGDDGLVVVPVHCIKSVVAMIPHPEHIPSVEGHIVTRDVDVTGRWCVVEKPGLEVAHYAGRDEDIFADDEAGEGEPGGERE